MCHVLTSMQRDELAQAERHAHEKSDEQFLLQAHGHEKAWQEFLGTA